MFTVSQKIIIDIPETLFLLHINVYFYFYYFRKNNKYNIELLLLMGIIVLQTTIFINNLCSNLNDWKIRILLRLFKLQCKNLIRAIMHYCNYENQMKMKCAMRISIFFVNCKLW